MSINVKVTRLFRPVEDSATKVKAYVDVELNELVLVKGLKVIQGTDKLFVSLPRHKSKCQKWHETVRILPEGGYEAVTETVMQAYDKGENIEQLSPRG